MTDLLAKSERKTISLDLDDKHALPKQISLTEPTLKKKTTHPDKEKEKKPTTKEKKIKAGGDTSIIDSILKKNKVAPLEKKESVNTDSVSGEPKKKMILDLNSGEQIITQDTTPVPEIKPSLQFVPEKPKATIILKSEAKKQKQINTPTPESQFKLDTLFNIDSVNKSYQTQAVASPVQTAPEPRFNPPSYESVAQNSGQTQLSSEPNVSNIDYVKELKEIDEQLAKVRAKLAKRGPDAKYLEIQQKLEARRAKYIRRQQRQESGVNAKTITPIPTATPTDYTGNKSISSVPSITTGHQFKKTQTPNKPPDLLDEVNFELNKAKDMLTSIEHNQRDNTTTGNNIHQSHTSVRKVIKEQGTSIFAVPSELTSMREKKEHLLAEQKKIAERIGHRQKQIDKIKNWQREVERMHELQGEKQKIFELQQDLKRLERQQYEQDQKLKGQMYQVRKMAHSKSNELKRLDMIDTFKSVKHRTPVVPVAQPGNPSLETQSSSGFGGKLRAAINSLFAGERVMFTKNNTIPAPIKQIEPVGPIIITEDAKTGFEYKKPVNDFVYVHPSTLPEINTETVIDLAKKIEENVCESTDTVNGISEHQINVYRDYLCDKVGISKKGIGKCLELLTDKGHTAILVNAYKELCDEISFDV